MKDEDQLKRERKSILQMIKNQSKISQKQLHVINEHSQFIEKLAEELQRSIDEVNNVRDEIRETQENILAISDFMIDFYNEYRKDDRITRGQQKILYKAMHDKASEITRIIHPNISESHERKSKFYKEWYKVIRALWAIYRHRVNNNSCSYIETPKIKFQSALEFINSLDVSDYFAYRDFRWKDIKEYHFNPSEEEKITIEKILEKRRQNKLISIE